MADTVSPAGWYADPSGQGEARYWNGAAWTQSVNRGGVEVELPIDPSQLQTPPAPGTGLAPPATLTPPPPVNATSSRRSPLGAIIGVLAVVLIVVLIIVVVNNSNSPAETPAPATDAPAEEPAPADEPAPTDGG